MATSPRLQFHQIQHFLLEFCASHLRLLGKELDRVAAAALDKLHFTFNMLKITSRLCPSQSLFYSCLLTMDQQKLE